MIDLEKELANKGMNLPTEIIFQFDNCGENKVSYDILKHKIKKCLIVSNFVIIIRTIALEQRNVLLFQSADGRVHLSKN
jgi:hypothetical protein